MLVWFKRQLLDRFTSQKSDVNGITHSYDFSYGIWENIADFFYGVHQEEAQKALSDLAHVQQCDTQKYDAFHRLRKLASDVFYDKFIEEGVKNIDGSWDITIHIKGWHINQDILQLNLKAVNAMSQ
ncbi:hypothetical protein [uncultured Shewanella sp.]|uniref:hypothetical protein n=1 Tax=uncultured Shewanella sp. TaxID=173975 RepID=UPI00262466D1|nr:hypothetical protein [uncultured Shewanella sp.]